MIKQIRNNIEAILNSVEGSTTPNVYNLIQSQEGYAKIEEMMLEMSLKDRIGLSATIPYIENMI